MSINSKIVYCLVGASGSGKTTLGEYMKKELDMVEIVSHTTRPPREGEIEGVHYYYISDEEFENIVKIEESSYTGKHKYCLSLEEVERKFNVSDKLFAIVDMNGARQVKQNCENRGIETKIIYIKTDLDTMKKRMTERGDLTSNIEDRLSYAISSNELENGKYADFIIDNRGSLENSKAQLKSILGL